MNELICEVCGKERAIGVGFGNKWVCGKCLLKLEEVINERHKNLLDEVQKRITEDE